MYTKDLNVITMENSKLHVIQTIWAIDGSVEPVNKLKIYPRYMKAKRLDPLE